MGDANVDALLEAVENLHSCKAEYQCTVIVKESFQSQTAWEGDVHIYQLEKHPKADICYAWASPVGESGKQKVYAVLHIPPVDSPEKAVRASIVSDYKQNNPQP